MKLLLTASLSLALVSTDVSAGYVQQFVDTHGSCRGPNSALEMLEDRVLNGLLLERTLQTGPTRTWTNTGRSTRPAFVSILPM